ncbi:MAG: type secretion system protein TssA [Pseudomonadota bacterium]|jgi:type VI secretion system protein ImpA
MNHQPLIQALLQPISPDAPCGQDLSFSIAFDQIAEMRREDDPTLEQGEWVTSLKVADWPGVAKQCTQLLQAQTKDLRVANWLTEAWAITEGFPGLARGLTLQGDLIAELWAGLYPLPDGADQEERIGTLAWMLHRVVGLIDTLPVTRNRQGQLHTLRDWQHARQPAPAAPSSYGQAEPQGDLARPTMELLQRASRECTPAWWEATLSALAEAEAALQRWQDAVDARLGSDGPGFVKAREKLASARHDCERIAREAGHHAGATPGESPTPEPTGIAPMADDTSAANLSSTEAAGGPPRTRAQALQRLREVAEYFRRTEPHSPVAYLADKAVKWGDMPLHEWLRQVVKDQGSMAHLQELLGLEDPSASN